MQNSTAARRRARAHRTVLLGLLLGASLGIAAGSVVALATQPAAAERHAIEPTGPLLDATHVPPLLTVPGEAVELRYDIHCARGGDEPDESGCAPGGVVYVRAGSSGAFRALPLVVDQRSAEGRFVARVPGDIARSSTGFTYYAVFTAGRESAGSVTLPPGGASAPHRSLPLTQPTLVQLGRHVFSQARSADGRVLSARWGEGPGRIGLEAGPNTAPAGGSSFDVDAAGNVLVLDNVGRRVLRWAAGESTPTAAPLDIDGTSADLAVAGDGAVYVLEGSRAGRPPVLRSFDRSGGHPRTVELAERTATQVRLGDEGPLVLQQPSGQWRPAVVGDAVVEPAEQTRAGSVGRPVPGGREVVVLRRGNEIRSALVQNGAVTRSWLVSSTTPLAEVQLAEPLGAGVLLVVRVYTDSQDEFTMLQLGPRGVVARASLDSVDWAETAPLSRFRLRGSSLYQLGSTSAGLFVDRFDLEVK
jgi:hypothetical protein